MRLNKESQHSSSWEIECIKDGVKLHKSLQILVLGSDFLTRIPNKKYLSSLSMRNPVVKKFGSGGIRFSS